MGVSFPPFSRKSASNTTQEGWSDFFATAIRLKKGDTRKTDYSMGAWVNGNTAGIRNYLYSTSMTTNPQTYKSVELYQRVHPIGNIWASMLYEVLWTLIGKYGKNDSDQPEFNKGVPTDGTFTPTTTLFSTPPPPHHLNPR
jgi:extracellular elastinolytic metalloproteinase